MNSRLNLAIEALMAAPNLIERVIQTLDEQGYPNNPFKCQRDFKLWITLAEWNGWCLQQNGFTKHCRILDSEDIRRAWGTKTAMFDALDQISKVGQGQSHR